MALTKIPTHMLFSGAASEDLSIDSDTLFIDSSANRVGIANNSPSVALDVTGSLTVSGTITGADLEIDSGTFSIDSSNNRVGIGTTSPSDDLDISSTGPGIRLTDTTTSGLYHSIRSASDDLLIEADVGNVGANTEIEFSIDGTERMRINSSGNIGIGETSPVAKIHTQGSGTSGQVTASWILENSSSGTAGMDITGTAGSSRLRFLYGGGPSTGTNTLSEAMNIVLEGANAGNVGIGETAPSNLLHVKDSDVGTAPIDTALLVLEKSGTNYLNFMGANTNVQGILFGDADNNDQGKIVYDHSDDKLSLIHI